MTVGLSPVAGAGWQFFDANGVPLSGGKLYTYAAGTTTPQTTYTSASGTVPNANPIILNSEGRVSGTNEVWLDIALAYKLILETSASVQLWSADDLSGIAGLGSVLPVASGGTGVSSNTAYAVLCGGTTSTNPIQSIASVGTAGQVLTSNGAGALPTMQAAFVSGMIILWSGSVASIPTGWLLCNGSSSTPDLRDRFVVGAGSTYAVGATGGSATATLPSHTHTATTTSTDSGHTHVIQTDATGGGGGSGRFVNGATGGTAVDSTNTGNASITSTTTNSTEGTSATNANLPPYYALCYIMKS
jgi:microcystin-dependent protein